MELPDSDPSKNIEPFVSILLPLLMTLFFIEGLRRFIIDVWIQNFIQMSLDVVTLSPMLVFLVPLLLILVRKRILLWIVAGSAILLILSRFVISLGLLGFSDLIVAFLIVGSYLIFLPSFVLLRAENQKEDNTQHIVLAIMLAIGLDVAIRIIGNSLDLTMTTDWLPIVFILAGLAILLVGLLVGVPIVPKPLEEDEIEFQRTQHRTVTLATTILLGMTMFGICQFLVLAILNPSTVSAWNKIDVIFGSLFLLIGLVISSILLVFNPVSFWLESRGVWEAINVITIGSLLFFVMSSSLQETLLPPVTWVIGLTTASLVGFFLPLSLGVNLNLIFNIPRFLYSRSFRATKIVTATGISIGMALFFLFLIAAVASYTYAYVSIFEIFREMLPTILIIAYLIIVLLTLPSYFVGKREQEEKVEEA